MVVMREEGHPCRGDQMITDGTLKHPAEDLYCDRKHHKASGMSNLMRRMKVLMTRMVPPDIRRSTYRLAFQITWRGWKKSFGGSSSRTVPRIRTRWIVKTRTL